jgi:hypothetical protein
MAELSPAAKAYLESAALQWQPRAEGGAAARACWWCAYNY